ncbi:MAG: hypothetical protein AABZ34_02910 [Nitrospirota bacterium]
MSEQGTPRSTRTTLDDLTLALMVSRRGQCSNEAVGDLRRYAESKKLVGARLCFADHVPHGLSATAARKVLVPSGDGYDESLELDRGFGRFDPYYTIPMRRT